MCHTGRFHGHPCRAPGCCLYQIYQDFLLTSGRYRSVSPVLFPIDRLSHSDLYILSLQLEYPAYITFDNAIAPVSNTLGPEGGGIFVMLSNFNHERWVMCCSSARSQRAIVEECLKWVNQRKAFGKPLSSQPVIRSKLAQMIARVESAQNWLENLTFQMCNMVSSICINKQSSACV